MMTMVWMNTQKINRLRKIPNHSLKSPPKKHFFIPIWLCVRGEKLQILAIPKLSARLFALLEDQQNKGPQPKAVSLANRRHHCSSAW